MVAQGGSAVEKEPLPEIYYSYPAIKKHGTVSHYLRNIKKYIIHMTRALIAADISVLYQKPPNFAISRNIDIDCILVHSF